MLEWSLLAYSDKGKITENVRPTNYGRDHLESKINYDFRKKNLKSL